MKIYNAVGYACFSLYAAACAYFAPAHLGPWVGLAVGMAYLVVCWFFAGLYLSCVIHMGIAHRALDYQEWFVKSLTLVNNAFGVYIDPVTWVNRHRLHHNYADHAGDPNKLASDGFWKTLYLCNFPYKTDVNVANDDILQTWPMRLVANPVFFVVAQAGNFVLLWWLVGRPGVRRACCGSGRACSRCGSTWSRTTGRTNGDGVTAATKTTTTR